MDSTGADRVKAIGAAWQRILEAAKVAAAKPPQDAATTAPPNPQEGK